MLRELQDCFCEKLGRGPYHVCLELDESVSPVIHPPRKIPIALLEPAKEKLLEMEQDGIIVKEEGHAPWVSSMLVIDNTKRRRESNEKVQPNMDKGHICIDPRDLNTALKIVHHPMITTEEVANKLSDAAMFTTLDACSDFWQLLRNADRSKLLTFNTP